MPRRPLPGLPLKNLFEGFPNGTLQPKDTLTRAQLAKLLTILDQNF